MEYLPEIVWLEILSHLSAKEVKCLRLVNQGLSENPFLRDHLINSTIFGGSETQLRTAIERNILPRRLRFSEGKLTLEASLQILPNENEEFHFREVIVPAGYTDLQEFWTFLQSFSTKLKSLSVSTCPLEHTVKDVLTEAAVLPSLDAFHLGLTKLQIADHTCKFHQKNVIEIAKRCEKVVEEIGPRFFLLDVLKEDIIPTKMKDLDIQISQYSLDDFPPVLNKRWPIFKSIPARVWNQIRPKILKMSMEAFRFLEPILSGKWRLEIENFTIKDWDHTFVEMGKLFPTLEKVTELTISMPMFHMGLHYYQEPNFKPSLEILSSLPSLKKLSLVTTSFQNVFGPDPTFKCEYLEYLHVPQYPLPPILIPSMKTAFPNLRELDFFEMSNQALLLVCETFTNLQKMRLGSAITDMGITGIKGPKNVARLMDDLENGRRGISDIERDGPFIGNMTKLKSVTVTSSKITNASIILGLAHCPAMRHMTFKRPVLSDRSLKYLGRATWLELRSLNIVAHRNVTEEGLQYLRDRLPRVSAILTYGPEERREFVYMRD